MSAASSGSAAPKASSSQKPRDAATLIIVDRTAGEPRVLMGRRRDDQIFMPGKYVFPGGRVDPADRLIETSDELAPHEAAKLLFDMKGGPSAARARALALAAVRETFEEAGLLIGTAATPGKLPDGESWRRFFAAGFIPAIAGLRFFARAITPPGRPRRYDTRFFCVDASAIAHRSGSIDGELSGLHWLTLSDARDLDLPSITRVLLEDLGDRIRQTSLEDGGVAVPYYHHRNGTFRRDLIRPDPGGGDA